MKPTSLGLRCLTAAVLAWAALIGVTAAQDSGAGGDGSGSSGSSSRSEAVATPDLPAPALFDVAWNDLADILEDVQPAFRPEAATHADAPILHLDYVLAEPTSLDGEVEARIVNRSAERWDDLWFHLFPNVLGGSLRIEGLRAMGSEIEPVLERDGALLRVPLPVALEPGAGVVISMDVAIDIPTGQQRNYSLLAYRNGIVSLAHAYPLPAVYRDGSGWDLDVPAPHGDLVFAEVAWFRARLQAAADLTLAATGLETLIEDAPRAAAGAGGSLRTWEVRAGPVRDLYLSLGPYAALTERVAGIDVRSFYAEGGEDAARTALAHAVGALDLFGAHWTPYPYTSFDVVPLATEALGVEFPGIVALATRLYSGNRDAMPWVVVHEVAHQWFYGLVGNDQVSEPWLDEALAQFAFWRYALERSGASAAAGVRRSLGGRWRRIDADIPIGLPVTAYSPAEYGSVVYGRGPLVVLEMVDRLGVEAFDRFLRGYVAAWRWDVATPAAFRAGVEAACRCSFDDLFTDAIVPR